MLLTLLVFILILGLLVFVHELGHFLVAKKTGVKVEEFAFGFRPRLYAKTIGGTTYAINLIPLGGYVKLFGEQAGETGPASFLSKSIAQRFAIFVAGATMNFLLGIVLLAILLVVGFNPLTPGAGDNPFVRDLPKIAVGAIAPNSPADQAGLKIGDQLTAVNGQTVATDDEFVQAVSAHKGQPTSLGYKRDGRDQVISIIPRIQPPAGEGALGVRIETTGKVKTTPLLALPAAIYETGRIAWLSLTGFGSFIITLVVNQKVSENVTGLIGVGALTGVVRRLGLDYVAQLVVVVSIGLGVINLLPIFPLDGGHIAALGYERISGRSITERQLGILTTIGLTFVLFIFLAVTYKDLLRFHVFGRLFS